MTTIPLQNVLDEVKLVAQDVNYERFMEADYRVFINQALRNLYLKNRKAFFGIRENEVGISDTDTIKLASNVYITVLVREIIVQTELNNETGVRPEVALQAQKEQE